MSRRESAPPACWNAILEAPVPTESGEYPIGVFSDAELGWTAAQVDETIASFADIGGQLRRRGRC
jgi:hypothetical protein